MDWTNCPDVDRDPGNVGLVVEGIGGGRRAQRMGASLRSRRGSVTTNIATTRIYDHRKTRPGSTRDLRAAT
jgi:hypothetical protein